MFQIRSWPFTDSAHLSPKTLRQETWFMRNNQPVAFISALPGIISIALPALCRLCINSVWFTIVKDCSLRAVFWQWVLVW
jgi:hypothetical protein